MMMIILVRSQAASSLPRSFANLSAVDDQPPPMPALGWDAVNAEVDRNRLIFLDHNGPNRRRVLTRMENRSPFPPGFVVGGPGGDPLGGKT